jgi:ATP-dependent Lon protease
MTGEITLRGRVLPIGGLKEKLLAALRGGIKTVIIPEENVKDLAEISEEIKNKIDIVPAAKLDDVLKSALVKPTERLSWDDVAETQAVQDDDEKKGGSRETAH